MLVRKKMKKDLATSSLRARAGRNVEGDDRVVEARLILHADRPRAVEGRHAADGRPRQLAQCPDRPGQRRRGIAEVRAEPDVGPDAACPAHWCALMTGVPVPAACTTETAPAIARFPAVLPRTGWPQPPPAEKAPGVRNAPRPRGDRR